MAELNKPQILSVIIPSRNEASRLPLLLADLRSWKSQLEICICDASSSDRTMLVSKLAGAHITQVLESNRGLQLHHGYCSSTGEWLLFLHADSRMPKNWEEAVQRRINESSSENIAWFFDFKIKDKDMWLTLLEVAVNIRSHFLKHPYGDQGLLISRSLYEYIGGYKPYFIMEDLDIIERLIKEVNIKSIGIPLYVDGRRWRNVNFLVQAWRNAILRKRWRDGESSKYLSIKYYKNDS